jgi:hypothetical protein
MKSMNNYARWASDKTGEFGAGNKSSKFVGDLFKKAALRQILNLFI